MPEYLAPGVYIEETSFRAKSIEGVSTSTAGFVGPSLFGPTAGAPELVTSLAEFERIYGSLDQLNYDGESSSHNYLAHGVKAFFDNGGKRLYVSRIYKPSSSAGSDAGKSSFTMSDPKGGADLLFFARFPGSGGNVQMTFTFRALQNSLAGVPRDPSNPLGPQDPVLRNVTEFDVVLVQQPGSFPPSTTAQLYWAERLFENNAWTWVFKRGDTSTVLKLASLTPGADVVRRVTVDVQILFPGLFPRIEYWLGLTFDSRADMSLPGTFADELSGRLQSLTVPVALRTSRDGVAIAEILMSQQRPSDERARVLKLLGYPVTDTTTDVSILTTLADPKLGASERRVVIRLDHGSDGSRPDPIAYEGNDDDVKNKTGLKAFEDLQDISIVAAPGYSAKANNSPAGLAAAQQVMQSLIGHAQYMRYRIAVLDAPDGQAISEIRQYRAQIDSTYAALYYPWVRIIDPITDEEVNMPPSGYVAGIYARNDIERGVHKAPANEVVLGAIGFEALLNKSQQDVLNPEGINCFRYFEGRGYRLWGARTVSSDPEWKYVNLRRYFAFLERSIEVGTQWVVFEPNSSALWGNVRRTIEDFLFNEWKIGHLMGNKPEQAFFVRCDLSTMTQNDLDNGRLVCLIGVAAIRPAEFVIFRIGQWTASQNS